jgi:hypothetical protein
MTNGVEGSTTSFAIQFAKDFDFTDRTSLSVGLGYAWLDAEVGNPVNSSTAGSSYEEVATAVLNDIQLGPALWANEHNIVLRTTFRHEWADGFPFTVSAFFQRRSGRPYSYTYEDDTVEIYYGDSDDEERVLIHVPTGINDPLYDFSQIGQAEAQALMDFINRSGLSAYAGGIAPKNGFNSPWTSDLDIRIQQDFRVFNDHTLSLFFDIENALNLFFGDDSNIFKYADTGDIEEGVRVIEVLGDTANTNQFVVSDWFDEGVNRDVDSSVWRLQLGVRYSF